MITSPGGRYARGTGYGAMVFQPLANVLSGASLSGAVWTLVLVVANRPLLLGARMTRVFLGALGILEAGLLVQAVLSTVLAFTTAQRLDAFSLTGYALTLPLILPIALVWGLNDRSRWGAGVVLIGLVTVPVMIARMNVIWSARV